MIDQGSRFHNRLPSKELAMPTYYVQSGSFRKIIEAESNRRAAVSAVQLTIEQVLSLDEEMIEGGEDCVLSRTKDSYAVLSGRLFVSEIGFEASDAVELQTKDIVKEWNHFVATLDRLERLLDSAV
jgi:hypothetical protein